MSNTDSDRQVRKAKLQPFLNQILGNKGKGNSSKKQVQAPGIQDTIPNDNKPNVPSSSTPHNSLTSDLPRNVLAFRTITKLLAKIQQEWEFQISPIEAGLIKLSTPDIVELKISNALATVAIIEHEVVAVVTNQRINPSTLEVIASVQSSDSNNTPTTKPSKKNCQVWLLAQNSRWSLAKSDASPTGDPTFSDAKNLAGIGLDADDDIKEYAEQYWNNLTIAKHLWILSKLLTMKEPTPNGLIRNPHTLVHTILPYVISTCHPKMLRRLKHSTSQLYVKSLAAINFIKSPLEINQPSEKEINNNRQFLLDYMLDGTKMYTVEIPELMKQAQLARAGQPFQLYTTDTCMEFHQLLRDILLQYQTSLEALVKARKAEKPGSKASDTVKDLVFAVFAHGYGLQRLAKGAGIKVHLQTIAPSLHNWILQQESLKPDVHQTQQDVDPDEDLEAVQPFLKVAGVEIPLWTSYVDWLRLMVAHFDAVDILIEYVTGKYFTHDTISVQIMVPPSPGSSILPWQELFADANLLPTSTIPDRSQLGKTNINVTNAGILEFIDIALTTSSAAEDARAAWKANDVEKTIKHFKKIETSNLPGWKQCAMDNLAKLRDLNGLLPDIHFFRFIESELQLLCNSALFFNCLDDGNFGGAMHCEACLASVLPTNGSKGLLPQMKNFGPIIGISKQSCPVCEQLLLLIGKGQIIVRGSHYTVTACTLPPWLPSSIIDSMNGYFGGQLRRELVELMDRSPLLRRRKESNGSHRLSSDSTGAATDSYVIFSKTLDKTGGAAKKKI